MALDNNNIYINSFQACDIVDHQYGKPIKTNFIGMIPFSLDTIKLEEFGMKIFKDNRNKFRTYDIINIKFKYSSKSYEEIFQSSSIERIEEKIKRMEQDLLDCQNKSDKNKMLYVIAQTKLYLTYLCNIQSNNKQNINKFDMRNNLYNNGFLYNGVKYVVFKRTSAKSRTGQVQFIKESLKNKAIRWARLGMDLSGLSKEDGVDYPSLLAYESLVSSSIVDTININPNQILLISDIISEYMVDSNVIEKGDDGLLISKFKTNIKMTSDLFDGESLIEESYIKNGSGSALLRQHMFKSCAFATKIQKFYIDYCLENEIDYNTFKVKDIFGNEQLAKEIVLITTPNSLKALKFSKRKGTQQKMYIHWKNKVTEDKNRFGVCKYEKKSTRGFDSDGKILNRTSYQILNSMPFSYEQMETLSKFEVDYISKLKNEDDEYIQYLTDTANETNSNEMIVSIYEVNKNILSVKEVKNKRKSDIFGYKRNVQHGRIRLSGDYCTICQNPKEMLYHSIGQVPLLDKNILDIKHWVDNQELIENEAHIGLHDFEKEYSAFRSPHTSPSNVLVLKNKKSDFIDKYMRQTNNIVYTNAINIEINRILSGQDVDSDAIVIFDDPIMLEVAKKCYKKYKVCENNIVASPSVYSVCDSDMARIDNILSKSQLNIGEIVNLGQVCMSKYWDLVNSGKEDTVDAKSMMDNVNICTILSEVAIDLAKRMYDIDIDQQIRHISKSSEANIKPMFFSQISKSKNQKLKFMKTSVDYLYQIVENIDDADGRKTMHMFDILGKFDFKPSKKYIVQKEKTLNSISKYTKYRNSMFSKLSQTNDADEKSEIYELIDREQHERFQEIGKYKLSKETMYLTLSELIKSDNQKNKSKTKDNIISKELLNYMNILYKINKNVFLSLF